MQVVWVKTEIGLSLAKSFLNGLGDEVLFSAIVKLVSRCNSLGFRDSKYFVVRE